MKNLKLKTNLGVEVELDVMDMVKIHKYYEVQCTAEYLEENYPDWSEEKIQKIAHETRNQMDKYDYTEEEAIEEAIELYEEA